MAGLGGGLAALAFWGFVAAIVVAGIWDGAKKREAQHETLRRIIESGKPVDQELVEKLLGHGQARSQPDRDLRVAAIIVLSIAPGLAILGAFVGAVDMRALMPILGAACLLACIGGGLMLASRYVRNTQGKDVDFRRHEIGS